METQYNQLILLIWTYQYYLLQQKKWHVIPYLSSASLLSIEQLCDDNCLSLFTKAKLFIFKQNKLRLQGKRNHFNGMWTILVPIQSVSIPSQNFTTENLLQHTNDNFKLKLNFQRLFRKLKTILQVHNVVQNTKYQDISKVVYKLKYLFQHVHNIKLISEQVNYIYAACFRPVNLHFKRQSKRITFLHFLT